LEKGCDTAFDGLAGLQSVRDVVPLKRKPAFDLRADVGVKEVGLQPPYGSVQAA
jgi:hypothetical protein